MERLTNRDKQGNVYIPECFSRCNGMGCSEKCNDCTVQDALINALAAYEDTNLIPERIVEVDKLYLEKCQEVNRLNAELAELKKQPQGDLIRRSATIDVIWDVFNQYCNDSDRFDEYDTKAISKAFKLLQSTLEKQPTAYDVDAVVEQLEEYREELNRFGEDGILTDMIGVVRNGGKE